ncbi:MAG: lytic transglycosylase domain-containing protein [Clostridia bacterium]|nr:lytic transglycosylase domain-containing protein [Clostridia bacterium]
MKRRRKRVNPIFLIMLAVLVIGVVSLLVSCQPKEEAPAINYVVEKKDYILDIPLSEELQEELYEASEEFGVDYYIMVALIERESGFENVVSDNGASYGYCQIQPKWWYGLMVEIGATDLTLAEDNFRVGCAIISRLTEKHKSVEGALVGYNQGSYNRSSTSYSREIIENAKRYKA